MNLDEKIKYILENICKSYRYGWDEEDKEFIPPCLQLDENEKRCKNFKWD